MLFGEFLLDTEEYSGIFLFLGGFPIWEGESEGEELNFRSLNVFGETLRGALRIDPDFGAEVIVWEVIEAIKDAVSDFSYDILLVEDSKVRRGRSIFKAMKQSNKQERA